MATYKGVEISLKPTEGMANNAQRGLDWREEFGRGGTAVGVARARQLVNRQELSPETVRRMVSFFARHEVDADAEGFNSGEEGFPSAGRIAHELWGGSSGRSWAKAKDAAMDRIDERGLDLNQEIADNVGEIIERAEPMDEQKPMDRHCLLYTSPSPRDRQKSRMPSSA